MAPTHLAGAQELEGYETAEAPKSEGKEWTLTPQSLRMPC